MNKLLTTLLAFTLLLAATSCTPEPTPGYADDVFAPYVQKFRADAKRYGRNFDDTALTIRFANLTGNKAGQCYMNRKTILIEIDRKYWDDISQSANAENLREELIFHEMGHGFTQRYHLNDQFALGDWKSMMFGDALPNNCEPALNYRGMRKEYYIKELFTQTTEAPEWDIKEAPDFSNVQEITAYEMDASQSKPVTSENQYYQTTLGGGLWSIHNKTDKRLLISFAENVNTAADFCVEMTFQATGPKGGTYGAGLVWGDAYATDQHYNIHYCELNTKKHMLLGEETCSLPFIDIYCNALAPKQYNTLKVRKHGAYVYFYINNQFVYYNDLTDLTTGGNTLGILLLGNTDINIQSLVVKADPSGVVPTARSLSNNENKVKVLPLPLQRKEM